MSTEIDNYNVERSAFTLAEATLETPVPTRRIVLELPDDKAAEVAAELDKIIWSGTKVEHELATIHGALGGWR